MSIKNTIHDYMYTIKLLDIIGGKEEVIKTLLNEVEDRVISELEEINHVSIFDTEIVKEDGKYILYWSDNSSYFTVDLDTLEVNER
jgi:hypothetical protein